MLGSELLVLDVRLDAVHHHVFDVLLRMLGRATLAMAFNHKNAEENGLHPGGGDYNRS